VAGGESAHIGIDRDNPVLIYGTSLLGTISVLNTETEEERTIEPYPYFAAFRPGSELRYRFNWNAPVVVSVHDPDVMYHAAQVVLKSTDRGQSWTDLTRNDPSKQGTIGGPIMLEGAGGEHYGTVMYLAESPHDAGTLWTGSDDGRVFVTRDGGGSWDDVTPRRMPEAQVNAIDVSPHDPAVAYIAVMRGIVSQTERMIELSASGPRSAEVRERGEALIEKIEAWEIHVPQPPSPNDVQDRITFPSRLLSTQVLHLISTIGQDPPVTAGGEQRAHELQDQWVRIKPGMREILENDLAPLNALLADSGVPHIVAESPADE